MTEAAVTLAGEDKASVRPVGVVEQRISDHVSRAHSLAWRFWTEEGAPAPPLQDACDALYTLRLLNRMDALAPDVASRYAALLATRRLQGALTPAGAEAPAANMHLTAYALGALNLLGARFPDAGNVLMKEGWRLGEIVDLNTLLPRYPRAWAHHGWRSGHWVGGAPSILLSLSRLAPQIYLAAGGPDVSAVLAACDRLVDPRTGFFKLYKSDLLHAGFNALYRLRHDPIAGEVGGVVHLHWVNYALGRLPYAASDRLTQAARGLLSRAPFMEDAPYCLDFDIVQIVRTASPERPADVQARAARYADDLVAYFSNRAMETTTLHKIPGALATLHECALIRGQASVEGIDGPPADIIAEAFWL